MARYKIGTLVRISKRAKDPSYLYHPEVMQVAEDEGELFIVMGYRGSKAQGNMTGEGEYKLKSLATGGEVGLLAVEVEKHR